MQQQKYQVSQEQNMLTKQEDPKGKNRSHLIQQNVHLRTEVLKMRQILQKIRVAAEESQVDTPGILLQKEEITTQARHLHKLKEQIAELKAGNCKQNAAYIRKEEDDLTFMKHELSAAVRERDIMQRQISEKKKALEGNRPLDQQLHRIGEECTKVRKHNRESAHKIVEIEREVRKYHQISTSGRMDPKQTDANLGEANAGDDIGDTGDTGDIGDIGEMHRNMRRIQQKWKPLMTQIDDQYIVLKGKLKLGEASMDKAEKEENIWKGRANLLRDQDNLKKDKERLAKVHADNPFIVEVKEDNPRQFLKKGDNERNSVGDAYQKLMLEAGNKQKTPVETPLKEVLDVTPVKKVVDTTPIKNSKSLGAELAKKIQMKVQEVKKFNQSWDLTDQVPVTAKTAPKLEQRSTEIIVKAIAQKIAIEVAKRNLSPQPQRAVASPPKEKSTQKHRKKESQQIIKIIQKANLKESSQGKKASKEKSVAPELLAPKRSISLGQKSLPSIQESNLEHNPLNFRYQICMSDIKRPIVSKQLHSKRIR